MNIAAAGNFTDHPRKINFRVKWAKPILKYLHERLQRKLVYLGLPGIRALDILAWQDHLQYVIAFQAENYEGRNEEMTAEEELDFLQNILNDLETKKIIDTYSLYIGYIEQVVMSGEDDYGNPFNLNDYVTVYNLDFCNTLSKPFPVIGPDFNTYDFYKVHVIEKLLSLERTKYEAGVDASFVMFLTVNEHFVEGMVSAIDDPIAKEYIKENLKGVTSEKRLIRLLKLYSFYKLNEVFKRYGFHIEILPTIYYQGSGSFYDEVRKVDRPYWLVTFTILGTPFEVNDPRKVFQQDFKEYLENKFVFINDHGISCFTEEKMNVPEKDFNPDIEELLSASHTVTTLWQ